MASPSASHSILFSRGSFSQRDSRPQSLLRLRNQFFADGQLRRTPHGIGSPFPGGSTRGASPFFFAHFDISSAPSTKPEIGASRPPISAKGPTVAAASGSSVPSTGPPGPKMSPNTASRAGLQSSSARLGGNYSSSFSLVGIWHGWNSAYIRDISSFGRHFAFCGVEFIRDTPE